MRRPAVVLPLLGVAVLLAGCGATAAGGDGDGSGGDDSGAALAGRTFVSTGDVGIPGGGPLNLQFTTDGRLLASAGCNSANGPVSLSGGRLDTGGGLAMTEMGCPDERMEADRWLGDLLVAEPTWELADESTFVLTAGELVVTMTDLAVLEPPVELTGRQWDVDGLSDGETASSMPVGLTAHLRFEDGTVSGFTGCNEVSGTAVVHDDTIAFADLVVSDAACAAGAAYVQDVVLAVLEGEARFSITGDRLSLETDSGFGLQAVAAA